MKTINCQVCGKTFVDRYGSSLAAHEYCSRKCREESREIKRVEEKERKEKGEKRIKLKTEEIICVECGQKSVTRKISGPPRKYCSDICRKTAYEKRNGPVHPSEDLSTGTSGAWRELVVSVDLMRKKWSVYRALSPHSPCDLMIVKANQIKRVEVTAGSKHPRTGKISYAPHDEKRYDILALVFRDGEIKYIPELSE